MRKNVEILNKDKLFKTNRLEPNFSGHQILNPNILKSNFTLFCSGQSNERQFLKDFVNAAPGSSGARLAAWLQPEPRLDLNQCELKTTQDQLRCGWPAQLTIITRDQYGEIVYIPDLKVDL